MAQVLLGETPSIDLTPFSPMRTALQRITP
jgi:hypothetical protein